MLDIHRNGVRKHVDIGALVDLQRTSQHLDHWMIKLGPGQYFAIERVDRMPIRPVSFSRLEGKSKTGKPVMHEKRVDLMQHASHSMNAVHGTNLFLSIVLPGLLKPRSNDPHVEENSIEGQVQQSGRRRSGIQPIDSVRLKSARQDAEREARLMGRTT